MSATHMNNFTLKNAASIPNAWYDAANYFEMNDKISAQQKCAWRNFCLTTSSIRCLEMIRVLAEEGYSSKEIYRLFSEKKYFLNIENVAEHNLAEWQRSDLILYKKSYVEYCDYFSKKGKKNRIKKKLLSLNVVCFLTENVLYKITLE